MVGVKKPFLLSMRKMHDFNDNYTLEECYQGLYLCVRKFREVIFHELYVWHVWVVCVIGVSHSCRAVHLVEAAN
mgnify:FL=1